MSTGGKTMLLAGAATLCLAAAAAGPALAATPAPAPQPASPQEVQAPPAPAKPGDETKRERQDRSPAKLPPAAAPTTSATQAPTAPGPARSTAAEGVTSYPPAFFADSRPNTAFDMIDRLPGFSFDGGEGVRGFAGAAGNVLIDGRRPASKSDSLEGILGRIAASEVERIDVIRGGAPGIDMQGRTVIANVIRKAGDKTRVTAAVGYHAFADGHGIPTVRLEFSRQQGERTFEASIGRFASFDDSVGSGFNRRIDAAGQRVADMDTTGDGGGINGSAAFKTPLWGGQLSINGSADGGYFKSSLVIQPPIPLRAEDRSSERNGEIGLRYDRPLGPVTLETYALRRQGTDEYSSVSEGSLFEGDTETSETILRGTVRWPMTDKWTFEAGLEGAINTLEGSNRLTVNGAPVDLPSSDVRVEERRGEGNVQAIWKATSRLTLEAGVRVEVSSIEQTGDSMSERSFTYPKPRAVLTWNATKDSQLRLRVERKVGQLDFDDFVSSADLSASQVNAGNPELRPDQRWIYEASYEHRFWGKGAVVVTASHAEITDVVDLVPIIGTGFAFDAPGNIGSGTTDTLAITATVPLDKLGISNGLLKTNTTWRISEVTDPLTGEERRISGQRPYTINAELSKDVPSWRSTFGVVYDAVWQETYYRLAQVQRREVASNFLQVYWDYKPKPGWAVRFEASNLDPFEFRQSRLSYGGPRNASPLTADDLRVFQSQPRIFIRLRKTFG